MPELSLGWDVAVTGDYTLAVDGASTTQLTLASTREEIEAALNETSGPVGLDVVGEGASFAVSTDTPAELTASGLATVTVTDPWTDPGPPVDGPTPERLVVRVGGRVLFANDVFDPVLEVGAEGEPLTLTATVAPPAIGGSPPEEGAPEE
jgi:hypothetical protein